MKFDWIAGTGGIGKGEIFRLIGDATLGREESRSAVLTDYRDYCKLHIILSYVARFNRGKRPVFALGKTGSDERGRQLQKEMKKIGLDTRYVRESAAPTKYSVCFLYENGDGGNITSCNDACEQVTEEELISDLNEVLTEYGNRGIVLGAPEVPLLARLGLLKRAKEAGCLTVCSVLADEADEFLAQRGAAVCDLLAVNADEAAAIGGTEGCEKVLLRQNKDICILMTKGKEGCDVCGRGVRGHADAIPVQIVSTAGAGDALLGGVICGLADGLPLYSEVTGNAVALGVVLASFAVQSPHTIPQRLRWNEVLARAKKYNFKF